MLNIPYGQSSAKLSVIMSSLGNHGHYSIQHCYTLTGRQQYNI